MKAPTRFVGWDVHRQSVMVAAVDAQPHMRLAPIKIPCCAKNQFHFPKVVRFTRSYKPDAYGRSLSGTIRLNDFHQMNASAYSTPHCSPLYPLCKVIMRMKGFVSYAGIWKLGS
jgi:hypothetical protein